LNGDLYMFEQITKKIEIPISSVATRLVKSVSSVPYKNLSVFITGSGDATKVTQEVFFGGYFEDSDGDQVPSSSNDIAVHKGGVSQGAAAAVGTSATEIANVTYTHALPLPGNSASSANGQGIYAAPVVLEFNNSATTPVTLSVTFIAETLTANQ